MKRYVIEFANDQKHPKTPEKNAQIDNVVQDYKAGLISPFEACLMIVDICKPSYF